MQRTGARRRGSKPCTPSSAAASASPLAEISLNTAHSDWAPLVLRAPWTPELGRWEREGVIILSPSCSSSGNTLHAERGLLSDSPTLLPYEILQFTLRRAVPKPEIPQRGVRGVGTERHPPPRAPGSFGNTDFQTPEEPIDLVTP